MEGRPGKIDPPDIKAFAVSAAGRVQINGFSVV